MRNKTLKHRMNKYLKKYQKAENPVDKHYYFMKYNFYAHELVKREGIG